jgi:glycosyltransferase involved in cell wall biosynthesis
MKIIIDLTYTPTGGSLTQILNMVQEFNLIDDIDMIIYSKSNNNNLLMGVVKDEQVILSRMANISIITRIFWGQFILPFYLKKQNADILFCPGNLGPIFSPVKTVIWIGTIGPFFEDFYTNFRWLDRVKLHLNKFLMVASSRRATAIIFESKFTKNLFVKKFKIQKDRSHVINIGFDKYFSNKNKIDYNDSSVDQIDSKYILCVSHLYPYKNIIRLLSAYKKLLDSGKYSEKLIIAGSRDYDHYNIIIEKHIVDLGVKSNVILLGKVSKRNLRSLYLKSQILIFPSPFENFAYTLVEAMSCGVPIVCSNTTAMPETCQGAALYFDPYNIDEMVEKMSLVLTDAVLRQKMSEKSIIRSKELPDYNKVTLRTLGIMKDLLINNN